MKKETKWALGISSAIALGGIIYYYFFKKAKCVSEEIKGGEGTQSSALPRTRGGASDPVVREYLAPSPVVIVETAPKATYTAPTATVKPTTTTTTTTTTATTATRPTTTATPTTTTTDSTKTTKTYTAPVAAPMAKPLVTTTASALRADGGG